MSLTLQEISISNSESFRMFRPYPLHLAKNGHFFVSDATTLTSYCGTNINKYHGLLLRKFADRRRISRCTFAEVQTDR